MRDTNKNINVVSRGGLVRSHLIGLIRTDALLRVGKIRVISHLDHLVDTISLKISENIMFPFVADVRNPGSLKVNKG